MKILCSMLLFAMLLAFSASAQKNKKDEGSGEYFLLKGSIYQVDMLQEADGKPCANVQVVVYQEKEIYVAFFTGEEGTYEFYLPLGHVYEIWYGGSAFVNKKVAINALQFPKDKKPRTIPMDIGLFRPVEGYDFTMLNEPYVKMDYNTELDQAVPDLEYTDAKSEEVSKFFKKIKKEQSKKKK